MSATPTLSFALLHVADIDAAFRYCTEQLGFVPSPNIAGRPSACSRRRRAASPSASPPRPSRPKSARSNSTSTRRRSKSCAPPCWAGAWKRADRVPAVRRDLHRARAGRRAADDDATGGVDRQIVTVIGMWQHTGDAAAHPYADRITERNEERQAMTMSNAREVVDRYFTALQAERLRRHATPLARRRLLQGSIRDDGGRRRLHQRVAGHDGDDDGHGAPGDLRRGRGRVPDLRSHPRGSRPSPCRSRNGSRCGMAGSRGSSVYFDPRPLFPPSAS